MQQFLAPFAYLGGKIVTFNIKPLMCYYTKAVILVVCLAARV